MPRNEQASRRAAWALLALGLLSVGACNKPAAQKTAAPATIAGKKPEAEIARVTLTPEAEVRLGIALSLAEMRPLARSRTVGGDVVPSSGRSLVVAAPVAGRIAKAGEGLRVGQVVKRGEALLRLTPVAGVDRDLHATAARSASVAEARLTAMDARVKRAESLLADGAGSVRAAEEARADRATAQAELAAAKTRVGMIDRSALDADVSVTLRAPEDGIIRTVSAPPATLVPAGGPLFELVGTSSLWVRANIFVGDLRSIRPEASARVRPLISAPTAADAEALPIAGPPTADPSTATFDLYFALGAGAGFRPGERVAVTLSLAGADSGLQVPASALMRDLNGASWVYEAVAEHAFERRRVEVDRVEGTQARLSAGLRPGASIVAIGAAELLGFEMGGK